MVDVINNHYCKITRQTNGKILVEHLTHNHASERDFVLISDTDLKCKKRAQYQSNISFELDENVVTSLV